MGKRGAPSAESPLPQPAGPASTLDKLLAMVRRLRRAASRAGYQAQESTGWMPLEDRLASAALAAAIFVGRMWRLLSTSVFRMYHRARRRCWAVLYRHVAWEELSRSAQHRLAREVERRAGSDGWRVVRAFLFLIGSLAVTGLLVIVDWAYVGLSRFIVPAAFAYLGLWAALLGFVPGVVYLVARGVLWRRREAVELLASVRCPACLYSLIGLGRAATESICPECGSVLPPVRRN